MPIDTFNTSGSTQVPEQGSQYRMITDPSRMRSLYESLHLDDEHEPSVNLDIDDNDLEENEIQLDDITRAMEAAVEPDVSVTPTLQEQEVDDFYEDDAEDEDDSECSEHASQPLNFLKGNLKLVLVIGGVLLVVIAVGLFIKIQGKEPAQQETSIVQPTIQRYSNDVLTPTDAQTYQDSMVITKYIELDQDTVIYTFEGYAENARAFIKMHVDLQTYNTFKTGARVPVLYERILIGDNYYFMKVRILDE